MSKNAVISFGEKIKQRYHLLNECSCEVVSSTDFQYFGLDSGSERFKMYDIFPGDLFGISYMLCKVTSFRVPADYAIST